MIRRSMLTIALPHSVIEWDGQDLFAYFRATHPPFKIHFAIAESKIAETANHEDRGEEAIQWQAAIDSNASSYLDKHVDHRAMRHAPLL